MNFIRIRLPRFSVAVEFTREGLIFVLLSVAIGAAAVNTGNNVLYLIFSLMLGLIVVSGIISRRILLGLNPQLDLPEYLFCGVENFCFLSITNSKKKFPSVGIRFVVKSSFFSGLSRYFFYIPAGSQSNSFAPVVFPRRGIVQISEMELQTRFPFSFFVKIRRYLTNQKVRVYPRVYRFSEEVIAQFTEGILVESPYRGESHQLLHLRDYRPFDPSKRIHWKASAKTERLLVKEFQRERGRDLYLCFDCYPSEKLDETSGIFEETISLFASISFLLSEKGFTGKIIFPDKEFELGPLGFSMAPLLNYLAEIVGSTHPPRRIVQPNGDTVVLLVRSETVPSMYSVVSRHQHSIFLEDWAYLLKDKEQNGEFTHKI